MIFHDTYVHTYNEFLHCPFNVIEILFSRPYYNLTLTQIWVITPPYLRQQRRGKTDF
jgi:hypothetical protein